MLLIGLICYYIMAAPTSMNRASDNDIPKDQILAAIRELDFDTVEVHVHEARATEIRQVRRTRFPSRLPESPPLPRQAGATPAVP